MTLYDQLSPEGKTLLDEAGKRLAAAYDPALRRAGGNLSRRVPA